jgi:hypothetical protein
MGDREITILHFNDVYNIEPGSRDPVGGAARLAWQVRKQAARHQLGPRLLPICAERLHHMAQCTATLWQRAAPSPGGCSQRSAAACLGGPPPSRAQNHQLGPAPPQVKSHSAANPLVLFSGDAFNPSIMSTLTLGKQMVPVLNAIGVHVSVRGWAVQWLGCMGRLSHCASTGTRDASTASLAASPISLSSSFLFLSVLRQSRY